MKILIKTLLLIAFCLDFGESSSPSDSPRDLRSRSRSRTPSPLELQLTLSRTNRSAERNVPELGSARVSSRVSRAHSPQELELSLRQPSRRRRADQSMSEWNAEENRASGSRARTFDFPIRETLPPPVQGPSNSFLLYRDKRIELLLDPSGTIALRADYRGNVFPSGDFFDRHNFLCRLNVIGGVKLVEYVHQDGSLIGVRAPIPTSEYVIMEPNEFSWFIVYKGKFFEVTQILHTTKAQAISLIPRNLIENGHRSRDIYIADFKFKLFKGPGGEISGAALP